MGKANRITEARRGAEGIIQASLQDAFALVMKPDKSSDEMLKIVAVIGAGTERAVMYLQAKGFSQKQARETCRDITAKIVPKIILQV